MSLARSLLVGCFSGAMACADVAALVAEYAWPPEDEKQHEAFLAGDWAAIGGTCALAAVVATPVVAEYAARYGSPRLLMWAVARNGNMRLLHYVAGKLAERGDLGLLRWGVARGLPSWGVRLGAAAGGHPEVLRWARAKGLPWQGNVFAAAIRNGHVGLLPQLHAGGCPWDMQACSEAALRGWRGVLKWLCVRGCNWDSVVVCTLAAAGGHLGVLRWVDRWWDGKLLLTQVFVDAVVSNAAICGQVGVLRWVRRRLGPPQWESWCELPSSGAIPERAAAYGQVAVLEWLRDGGWPVALDVWGRAAAQCGQVEVLRWLHGVSAQRAASLCQRAANAGRLVVFPGEGTQHAARGGVGLCTLAAARGQLAVLQAARAEGWPPLDGADVWRTAACNDHDQILQWAHETGLPWDANVCEGSTGLAARAWFLANGCPHGSRREDVANHHDDWLGPG